VAPYDAGRPYDDFWALGISAAGRPGRKFFDQLAHLRWSDGRPADVYQAPPLHYLGGEPAFVGDPSDPSRGAVICPVFDAGRRATSFAVFDAFAVSRGPVATLRLKAPIHLAFHATFQAEGATVAEGDRSPES
jgi:carotenoid cleavage dioxygenase-like enzyme